MTRTLAPSGVRVLLSAFEAQKALAEAFEAHVMDASLLLHCLPDRLAEIDQTEDMTTRRTVIERLVHAMRIDTQDREPPAAPRAQSR